jgi:hypothetical protein
MKKFILLSTILALAACGGVQGPLKPGRTPDTENAILVAKVELSPAINDDWRQAKDDDKMMEYGLITTPGNGEDVPAFNEDRDTQFGELRTNEFVAFEVKGGQNIAIRDLKFYTYHKAYWLSNTEHFYYTTLSNPSYAIPVKPEAGKAYYIGTIKIQLNENKSFEVSDGEINRKRFQLAVPKSIAIADEYSAAKKWFAEKHEKVGTELKNAPVTMKNSGQDNDFTHSAVTTTYR